MTDSELGDVFGRDLSDALDDPVFTLWLRAHDAVADLLECEMLDVVKEKDVIVTVYTDKQRSNVLFTLKQSAFDDPTMRELAANPGTTVEQVQAQARKVVQSGASSDKDIQSAAYLVQLIKDYQKG